VADRRRRKAPEMSMFDLAAWSFFRRPEWKPFKEAWIERGFRTPPSGRTDERGSLRALLWIIAQDHPQKLAEWVRSAPGKSQKEVVDHVIEAWRRALKAGVGDAAREGVPPRSAVDVLRPARRAPGGDMDELDPYWYPMRRTLSRPQRVGELLGQDDAGSRQGSTDDGEEGTGRRDAPRQPVLAPSSGRMGNRPPAHAAGVPRTVRR